MSHTTQPTPNAFFEHLHNCEECRLDNIEATYLCPVACRLWDDIVSAAEKEPQVLLFDMAALKRRGSEQSFPA